MEPFLAATKQKLKICLLSCMKTTGNTVFFLDLSVSLTVAAAACVEAVKTELREQASGHSSASDVESDSDSPTEVKGGRMRHKAATVWMQLPHLSVSLSAA